MMSFSHGARAPPDKKRGHFASQISCTGAKVKNNNVHARLKHLPRKSLDSRTVQVMEELPFFPFRSIPFLFLFHSVAVSFLFHFLSFCFQSSESRACVCVKR